MIRPHRPSLESADDLTQAADIDLNQALSQLIEQRTLSPDHSPFNRRGCSHLDR